MSEMIETETRVLEEGKLRRFPLSFEDAPLERDFLTEYGRRSVRHLKDNYPWVVATLLLGAIVFFIFQPTAILVYATASIVFGIFILMGLMLRSFPPSEYGLQILLVCLGVGMGWVYSTGVLTLAGSFFVPYIGPAIAVHIVFMCMCTPIRFAYVIHVIVLSSAAYLVLAIVSGAFTGEDLLLQVVLGLGLYSFCLINAYQRERLTRVEFIQRRIIAAREQALAHEKDRSESLLLNILPSSIADQLKGGQQTIADVFDSVSVLFVDIVGFTPLSKQLEANEVVDILNEIFHLFDDLCLKHGLEKIKTIGDAYMVASGLPERRDDHADAIAEMAIGIRQAIAGYCERSGRRLEVRIGINSGPVVAGVIGKTKFAYDLWGDTVNTASRMESHGIPGGIQVAPTTFELLKDRFEFDARGEIEVKGHGPMETFMLKSGTL